MRTRMPNASECTHVADRDEEARRRSGTPPPLAPYLSIMFCHCRKLRRAWWRFVALTALPPRRRRLCRGGRGAMHRSVVARSALATSIAAATAAALFIWPQLAYPSVRRAAVGRWFGLSFCDNTSVQADAPWAGDLARFSCSKLFANDGTEQSSVRSFLRWTPRPEPCYRDCYLSRASCSELLTLFRRPFDFTDDELDFPLAYGLRVHTCATQVELLLRAIYAPHNVYCLHIDGRSPRHFIAAMHRLAACLPNVLLAPIDENFVYASASQMEADLECMQAVRDSPVRWRYFINLAGQELPLKTNYELVQMFRSLNGSSHVYFEPPVRQRHIESFWCKNKMTNRTVWCPQPHRRKRLPPGGIKVNKSYANAEFSRAFVDYVLDERSFARRLYVWLSDTFAPEEHYYATLLALPDTPGGVWSLTRTRAMIWQGEGKCAGRLVRDICIMTCGDLPWLVGRPEPFVNKLHYEDDPVAVQCLVQSVMEREEAQHSAASVQRQQEPLAEQRM